jgi:ribosome-binding protein aMBF1 (putative translation factor)
MTNGYGALLDAIEADAKEAARQQVRHQFAARIVAARQAIGITQNQMADMLQVSRSTYAGYEQAATSPAGQKAKAIVSFLTRLEKHLDIRHS